MVEYRIRQDGVTVAQVSGSDLSAESQIMHYAQQYKQDGEVIIEVRHMLPSGPAWKRHMLIA